MPESGTSYEFVLKSGETKVVLVRADVAHRSSAYLSYAFVNFEEPILRKACLEAGEVEQISSEHQIERRQIR